MKRQLHILWNEDLIAIAITLISFGVYVTTMCRTVSFIDSGELATVGTVLGIAHPTGYPLFTLLARCVVMLPIGLEQILQLNLFTAFVTAVAIGVFFRMSLSLWDLFQSRRDGRTPPQPGGDRKRILTAAFAGSLIFAFSMTVWGQSTAIEVYGLHLLLLSLVILTCARGLKDGRPSSPAHPSFPPRRLDISLSSNSIDCSSSPRLGLSRKSRALPVAHLREAI